MTRLKTRLQEKIEEHRPRTTRLLKEFGKVVIDEVTIDQCIGGARDIKCLVTDISYLDPQEGIRFRGKNIPETFAALPKLPAPNTRRWSPSGTSCSPARSPPQARPRRSSQDFKAAPSVPAYVFDVLRALPKDSHPMVMLSTGMLAMQKESKFNRLYHSLKKNDYWDYDVRGCLRPAGQAARRSPPSSTATSTRTATSSPRPEPRHGRQLRPHDGHRQALRRRGPDVLHPPQRPRERQRQRPHHPPGGLRALRCLLRLQRRPQRPGGPPARPGQPGSAGLDHGIPEQAERRRAHRGERQGGALGHPELRPRHPRLRPRRAAQDRPPLHRAAGVLPEAPAQ